MAQGMAIEQPEDVPDFPVHGLVAAAPTQAVTIGQFYGALDQFLSTLPASAWKAGRHQVTDAQFLSGQLFAVNGYDDAHRAIRTIISEGEGAHNDPLDFQDEIAHYYRFGEIYHRKVLTKSNDPLGYAWGPDPLAIDWTQAFPAIANPGAHDFSREPAAAQAAQAACNGAYTAMVQALQRALTGDRAALGVAVSAMFGLRMAAMHAFTVPLLDASRVAGPAFIYSPN
jgi:hypothetical protein